MARDDLLQLGGVEHIQQWAEHRPLRHDTGIPMGPIGIPWKWEAQTEFMRMGRAMGMVDRK